MKAMTIEEKLSVDKFFVDEGNPHIIISKDAVDPKEIQKLIKACPAGLYSLNEDGTISFDYAGCLECGTCRVLCKNTIIKEWNYPQATCGIEFRYG
ncbi:MAG: ferredoxin family protein [Eubacteriales bacterium]